MLNPTRRPVVLDTTTRFAPTVKQEEEEAAPRWVRGRWAGQVLVQLPLPSVEWPEGEKVPDLQAEAHVGFSPMMVEVLRTTHGRHEEAPVAEFV